jgi:hypothetical protein
MWSNFTLASDGLVVFVRVLLEVQHALGKCQCGLARNFAEPLPVGPAVTPVRTLAVDFRVVA